MLELRFTNQALRTLGFASRLCVFAELREKELKVKK